MLKRLSLWAALVAASFAGLAPAAAETPDQFPTKPITLIIPFQAGVSADLLFRG
jgi:tripartite-type tricarboxylate transporter receptor subunit TctC